MTEKYTGGNALGSISDSIQCQCTTALHRSEMPDNSLFADRVFSDGMSVHRKRVVLAAGPLVA